jgi:hypothetical protein
MEDPAVASKEELKAAIHAAFDQAVPGGAEYTKVYASDMKQKNFIVYRSTTIYNYAVGFKPGQTELVILPIDENKGQITTGTPVTVTDQNRGQVKKRDLQGRFKVSTTDGQTFRFSVIPSVPKIASAFYQLPVDQKAEYEAFQAVRDLIAGRFRGYVRLAVGYSLFRRLVGCPVAVRASGNASGIDPRAFGDDLRVTSAGRCPPDRHSSRLKTIRSLPGPS